MSRLKPTAPPLRGPIHCIGICSRLLGGVAAALKDAGVFVTGSDSQKFPPVSELLARNGIEILSPMASSNLPAETRMVITASSIESSNPEWVESHLRGLEICHITAFLERYYLTQADVASVAGTKGKSTTTAMLAWILDKAQLAPDFVLGGQIRDPDWGLARLRGAPLLVIEGDEYPCAAQDPVPKFHRHHPRWMLVTNICHDHLDVFPTVESYVEPFREAVRRLPQDGSLILSADDAGALALGDLAATEVRTVGFSPAATHVLTDFRQTGPDAAFRLQGEPFRLKVPGRINATNAGLAAVMAEKLGVSLGTAAAALASFPGVTGRQELLATIGASTIYGDESYHPLALKGLLPTLIQRHPGQRLLVVLVPVHTGGLHGVAQRDLPESLSLASAVFLFPHCDFPPLPAEPFSPKQLRTDLARRGVPCHEVDSIPSMIEKLKAEMRDGDVLVFCLGPGPDIARRRIIAALLE